MMRMYGTVKLVRICSKDTKGKLPTWLTVRTMPLPPRSGCLAALVTCA